MELEQRLQKIITENSLTSKFNDRLFYSKYLYRLEVLMYRYVIPEIYSVKTVDVWGYKVDTTHRTNFISAVRKYAKKHGDRVRVENGRYLLYYTNELDNIERIIKYVNRLKNKQDDITGTIIDLGSICIFPGEKTERNVRYRKNSLPYKKYRFQVFGDRMSHEEVVEWREWALQYPDKIKLSNYGLHGIQTTNPLPWGIWHRSNGIWSGEPLGYILDEKMLHLVQFKLGSNINKVIEFQIRKQSNDE